MKQSASLCEAKCLKARSKVPQSKEQSASKQEAKHFKRKGME